MTSPSSYVFYEENSLTQEREAGTQLNRVYVSPNKITVYLKRLVQTAESEVLLEKTIDKHTYSLHENRYGVKYIKRLDKLAGEKCTDMSLLGNKPFFSIQYRNEQCRVLVESTILSWFGKDYYPDSFQQIQDWLYFPLLADAYFPSSELLKSALERLQASGYKVAKLLRESNSWETFMFSLCPAVETVADIDLVRESPEHLLPIAAMNLGKPLSSFSEKKREILRHIRRSYSWGNTRLLSFMLQYLSDEHRTDAVDTLLSLTERFRSKYETEYDNNPYLAASHYYGWKAEKFKVSRIPPRLRAELATKLLVELKECFKKYPQNNSYGDMMKTGLSEVVEFWYAREILEPQMKSELTLEDVEQRFYELFKSSLSTDDEKVVVIDAVESMTSEELGTALRSVQILDEDVSLSFERTNGLTICCIDDEVLKGRRDFDHTDVFTALLCMIKGNRPKDRSIDPTGSSYSGYVDANGEFTTLSNYSLYSLDDILAIIELGVKATDAELVRLGCAVTPENRVAFLTFGSKERKFKKTWEYYGWGVTDRNRILALQKSDITTKNDVQTYNALPDDMFYELLALESGKQFTMSLNEGWV